MAKTYYLTDTVRKKFNLIIKSYIDMLENSKSDDVNELHLDLTDMGISPMQLQELLVEFGYTEDYTDTNGWQCDYWMYFENAERTGYARRLCIYGTAIAFSIGLGPE